MPVNDALVTDTTAHQAYLTDQELRESGTSPITKRIWPKLIEL